MDMSAGSERCRARRRLHASGPNATNLPHPVEDCQVRPELIRYATALLSAETAAELLLQQAGEVAAYLLDELPQASVRALVGEVE